MYGIDFNNQLVDYLLDDDRKIPKAHLEGVCKIEQKDKTCRFIALSKIGYVCMKKSPAKVKLDEMAKDGNMVAQSDNCEGLGDIYGKS
jgi:hypothetical protein